MSDIGDRLTQEDKLSFPPFSYAKAIIKDDITYPIIPNCPIISAENMNEGILAQIPIGTLFIVSKGDEEEGEHFLTIRVPDNVWWVEYPGLLVLASWSWGGK